MLGQRLVVKWGMPTAAVMAEMKVLWTVGMSVVKKALSMAQMASTTVLMMARKRADGMVHQMVEMKEEKKVVKREKPWVETMVAE